MATLAESIVRPVPAWRLKLTAFWRWWVSELVQFLPDRFAGRTRVPVLVFEGGDLVLTEPRLSSGGEARVAAVTLESASARAAVTQMLERAGETRGRARLGLGLSDALVHRVSMPAATEENLRQVVGFEMDRLTPFRAEEVYLDQRVISRDQAAGQIGVEFALALRVRVDAGIERLRKLGVSVQGVAVCDRGGHGVAAFDLLPSEQRGQQEAPNERLVRNILVGAVVVLLLVAMLLPAYQKRDAIIALHPVIAKAKQEAEATDAVVRALDRQVADYNFMMAKRHAPQSLAYLEDVSRLLPDNTWVQQFDIRNAGKVREIQIVGETPSSSKLIELLEQSPLLQNSAPKGTVTRGTQPGTERFMIVAEAKPRALPEMLAIKDIAALPAAPITPLLAPTPVVEAPAVPAHAPAAAAAPAPTATLDVEPAAVAPAQPGDEKVAAPAAEPQGEIAKMLARQAKDRKDAAPSEAAKARMTERTRRSAEAYRQQQQQKQGGQ